LDAVTARNASLLGNDDELYYVWLFSAWAGVPMILLNNEFLSVTTSTGWPNFGLAAYGLFFSWLPLVLLLAIWYMNHAYLRDPNKQYQDYVISVLDERGT
jgi:hypothetical protein